MGGVARPVDLTAYVSARDRALIGEILGAAQLLQAYAGLPRTQFLRSAEDQAAARTRLQAIATSAREVSERTRNAHPGVPWDALAAGGTAGKTDPVALWNVVKKVVPRAVTPLRPLVGQDTPATVFLLELPSSPKRQTAPAKRGGKKRQPSS